MRTDHRVGADGDGCVQLRARIADLGREFTRDYAGRSLVVVAVLKGSFVFVADLVREVKLPLEVEFIGISSYAGTSSSGVVQITQDLSRPIAGEHVLLVEDIVDSGLTMAYLLDNLSTRRPASVQVCALLEKPTRAKVGPVGAPAAARGPILIAVDRQGAHRVMVLEP